MRITKKFFDEMEELVERVNKLKQEKDIKPWLEEKEFLLPLSIAYYNKKLARTTWWLVIATWVLAIATIATTILIK